MLINKVAILIDGGFYIQQYKKKYSGKHPDRNSIEKLIAKLIESMQSLNRGTTEDILFRTFYYDCPPFDKVVKDLDGNEINYADSSVYKEKNKYLKELRFIDQFAIRSGEISFSGWKINPYKPKSGKFVPDFRQKGVDMKIGLDIAWMSGKKSIDKIVLVTGDSDFISPMKLARREGILIYLCPLGAYIKAELREHTDFTIFL